VGCIATIRLTIAYDGAPFSGWAAQQGLRTIEGELSAALATILRAQVSLSVAGRTDAGVHAWGQVASFELDGEPPGDLLHRLNGVLPNEIVVQSAAVADNGFDARRDALSRIYCYRLLVGQASPFERGRSLHWPHPLDREGLERCAELVRGVHDFTAFTPTETEHVRFERDVARAEWRRTEAPVRGELLEFWIEADAFMRNMVRVLVGTMLEVAAGRRTLADLEGLLNGAPRPEAGETAPAHGLYLAAVRYD
jgi:tRNA pseudouridine38-40 synthase